MFHRLSQEELREIVDITVREVTGQLREREIELVLTPEAKDFIVAQGTDEEYGARPLRRAVQQFIEDPLSEQLLLGAFEPGSRIEVRPSDISDEWMLNTVLPVAGNVSS